MKRWKSKTATSKMKPPLFNNNMCQLLSNMLAAFRKCFPQFNVSIQIRILINISSVNER